MLVRSRAKPSSPILRVQSFQETRNVIVFFPAESSESSTVLLVHDPLSSQGNIAPAAKQKHLHEVAQEISKLVPAASNVKTETITISKKWHSSLIGNLDRYKHLCNAWCAWSLTDACIGFSARTKCSRSSSAPSQRERILLVQTRSASAAPARMSTRPSRTSTPSSRRPAHCSAA